MRFPVSLPMLALFSTSVAADDWFVDVTEDSGVDFEHVNGYVGAYLHDGFTCPLILQIARELPALLPGIFGEGGPMCWTEECAWFEGSELPAAGFEIAPIIHAYRQHQADIHRGAILPIGVRSAYLRTK